jgi:hypothetical protein
VMMTQLKFYQIISSQHNLQLFEVKKENRVNLTNSDFFSMSWMIQHLWSPILFIFFWFYHWLESSHSINLICQLFSKSEIWYL